jgi:hypothetical protein
MVQCIKSECSAVTLRKSDGKYSDGKYSDGKYSDGK